MSRASTQQLFFSDSPVAKSHTTNGVGIIQTTEHQQLVKSSASETTLRKTVMEGPDTDTIL